MNVENLARATRHLQNFRRPSNFFVAANGRCGTLWLAKLLNQSPTHMVRHEEAEPNPPRRDYWRPFPLARWNKRCCAKKFQAYGECHGYLWRCLSPEHRGGERHIPGRFVLLRSKKSIIRSWMRRNHSLGDLAWVCVTVCNIEARLIDYAAADPACGVLVAERLWSDLEYLRDFCEAIGARLNDNVLRAAQQTPANETTQPTTFAWTATNLQTYQELADRFSHKDGLP